MIIWLTAALAADVTISVGDDVASLTSSLTPGDTVLFEAGTYEIESTLSWSGEGTEAEPITLKPVDGAEVEIRHIGGGYAVDIRDSAFVVVEGFTITGGDDPEATGPSGLQVADSTDVTVRNVTIDGVWNTGLRLDGDTARLLIEGNEIADLGNGSGISIGCGDASCWMQDSTLVGNLIHDVAYTGISMSPGTQGNAFIDNVVFRSGDSGIYVSPTENGEPNIVEGNAIWQTGGHGLYVEGSAIIRNNVVFETGDDGLYTNNNDRNGLYDTVISHNTFARTEGYGAYLSDFYEGSGLVFANNAIANPTGYGLYWDDDFEDLGVAPSSYVSANVVAGLVDGFSQLDYPGFVRPGGGYSDFVDADNFDFYPENGSTLVDAGDTSGDAWIPELDFNGSTRQGDRPDAGAYEYVGAGNPGWVIREGFKEYGAGAGAARYDVGGGCCGKSDAGGGTEAALFLPLLALGLGLRRRERGA